MWSLLLRGLFAGILMGGSLLAMYQVVGVKVLFFFNDPARTVVNIAWYLITCGAVGAMLPRRPRPWALAGAMLVWVWGVVLMPLYHQCVQLCQDDPALWLSNMPETAWINRFVLGLGLAVCLWSATRRSLSHAGVHEE
jgi:hypothetical protein